MILRDCEELERVLSEPTPAVIEMFRQLDGDILVLGAGGKMGPTLTRMAKRGSEAAGTLRRIIAVSRFSSPGERANLEKHGVETIACDLLDVDAVAHLPDARNVIFMAGMKFGATGNAALTWAMNTTVPAIVVRRFSEGRIAAFSTGNIYGLSPVARGGSVESDAPNPVGEYAMSCLGRERVFEHGSRSGRTPVAIIRLNYACELRYGVLVDVAQRVWHGEPVDLAMGRFNVLWQGDANAWSLLTLMHVATPPFLINVTGPETLSVRAVAEDFAQRMGRRALFRGEESETALLSDASRAAELFGAPRVSIGQMIQWIAEWTMRGGPTLAKPTHFENREGTF